MSKTPNHSASETFLSDWLAGKITDDQLKALVSDTDFRAYQKLRFSLQAFEVPQPDMERNFAEIQQKISAQQQPGKSKVKMLLSYAAVAAFVLLFFGLCQFFAFSNTVETGFCKTANLHLKDHSEVTLNAKSKISYPTLFEYNRSVKLEGQAFFKVTKGRTFTVETPQGNVQVLGTQFNVIANPNYLEVQCYEGSVKVTAPITTEILTRGKAMRIYKNNAEVWETSDTSPSWIAGESTFKNAPLQAVITEFQNQYHSEVYYPKALSSIRFTGSFTHHNIHSAIQSICLPMHLNYTKTSGTITISE